MIGRLRYKIIRTEVSNNEERLEISQKIHRFLRKEKENHLEIKLSEIGSMELKTKNQIYSAMVIYGLLTYNNGQVFIPNKELMLKYDELLFRES